MTLLLKLSSQAICLNEIELLGILRNELLKVTKIKRMKGEVPQMNNG